MSEPLIRARNLGKKYRRRLEDRGRLFARLRSRDHNQPFWALRNCSFDIGRGELVGIIGANGAGKSTLLKILSRITRPNEGTADVYGRVGSLLEVGTGFHPELTGRENVFLNGALIGMGRHEIRRKFDDIVSFAGVGASIDMPIKRYSSGMKVRLAFAVAAHLEQEIMLVDEVLAVGDSAFRMQCFNKINEVTRQGRTVLLVSHELTSIARSCDRAIWIDTGSIRADGRAPEVVGRYLTAVAGVEGGRAVIPIPAGAGPAGGELEMTHIRLLDDAGQPVPCFATGQPAKFGLGYRIAQAVRSPITVSLTILNSRRQPVAVCEGVAWTARQSAPLPPRGEFICEVGRLPFVPGRYSLDVAWRRGQDAERRITGAGDFVVTLPFGFGALPAPGAGDVLLEHRWSIEGSDASEVREASQVAASQQPPAASVVVISYNSQKTIRACLKSLTAQTTSLPFEVLVVDSSTDSTPEIVAREFEWVKLIHLPERAFPGKARNVGIRHAAGEIVAFLASDCVADPGWLEARVQGHREGFAAVGGAITNANPRSVVGWANYLMEYIFCLPSRPREVVKGKIIHNLSYRRELFDRYGVFSTDLCLGEDTIFNRKLMLHDEPVLFDPSVRTGHINPTSLRRFLAHQYDHGADFFRACRNGELSYFRTEMDLWSALYQVLVSYPGMRVKTSIRQVMRHRPMTARQIISFPLLVLGIFSAALGAASELLRPAAPKPLSVRQPEPRDAARDALTSGTTS